MVRDFNVSCGGTQFNPQHQPHQWQQSYSSLSFYATTVIILSSHRPASCDFASSVSAIFIFWNTLQREPSLHFRSGLPILWPFGYLGFWWSLWEHHSAQYSYICWWLLSNPTLALGLGMLSMGLEAPKFLPCQILWAYYCYCYFCLQWWMEAGVWPTWVHLPLPKGTRFTAMKLHPPLYVLEFRPV